MKKHVTKRFLSMLLVLVMTLSTVSMSASASEFKSIDIKGNEVNVAFGADLDPNELLTTYDIKVVGAVLMDYDADNATVSASSNVELYIPKSLFINKIEEKISATLDNKIDSLINPALELYNDQVTYYSNYTVDFETTVDYEIIDDVEIEIDIDISGTLADLIELIRSGTHTETYNGVDYTITYSDLFEGDTEDALKEMVDSAVKHFNLTRLSSTSSTANGRAYKNWLASAADSNSDANQLANSLVAVLGLKYAQEEYENSAVRALLATVNLYTGSENNEEFKDQATISADLEAVIEEEIENLTGDFSNDLLADIGTDFYGPLNGDTLTDRFDCMQEIIDTFIADTNNKLVDYGVVIAPVTLDMPYAQINYVENTLKTIVSAINDVEPDSVVIDGKIAGFDMDNDALSVADSTGMYVVAGVNSQDFTDKDMEFYVIAPEIVSVMIQANGSNMGYFERYTVGESYEITTSVGSGYNDNYPPKLYITGVETDGNIYNSSEEPTNAGVYTVFSFYFNKETMAMGGDVAILVIEPKDTPTDDFKFTDDMTVSYNGDGHFPELTNPKGFTSISIAADKNNADVYVMLPDNFGDTVGSYTDRAEDILSAFENKTENTALALPEQMTAKILGALTALDNYANAAEGPGVVTNEQIKTRLTNYLTAISGMYDPDKIVEKAGNAVDKVTEALSTNETVLKYVNMMKTVTSAFESFNNDTQAAAVMTLAADDDQTSEQSIAQEFLTRFVDATGVDKEDIGKLQTYVATYKQDAVTLIKTLGAIGKVESNKVYDAIDEVEAAFDVLKSDVKAKLAEIDERNDSTPTTDDAKDVLGYVETFIQSVVTQTEEVVKAFTVQNIYFGIEPSEVGVYDCYAVNISSNYIPNLTTATLEITHVHTPGEPVIENNVDADCMNDGSYDTVVYCSECEAEISRETTVVPAPGHTPGTVVIENEVEATATTPASYDEVIYCTVCDEEISRNTVIVPGNFVCVNQLTNVYYTDLSDALEDADAAAPNETILMLQDYTEKYVIIAPGTTLDLADHAVTATFVIGMNGSYLTATPNAGKLIAPKENVTLSEQGYVNADNQYILPIWDSANQYYLFSQFVVNTDSAEHRGLTVDEANEQIYFRFKHQATGAINKSLLNDGASDNALTVIVRLVWNTGKGAAFQDFVYNDGFVAKVAVGENGIAYDYTFTLNGYSAMNIDLSTLTVTGMVITDSGAVAYGETWMVD